MTIWSKIAIRALPALYSKLAGSYSCLLFRIFAKKVGRNFRIGPGVYVNQIESIEIGQGVRIAHRAALSSEIEGGWLRLEDGVQINSEAHLDFSGSLIVGRNALISEGAIVYTHDHGEDPRSKPAGYPLVIGENAWLGVRSIILPTCHKIGSNAIVGAGAIVTRDVPDNAIVTGPAGNVRRLRT